MKTNIWESFRAKGYDVESYQNKYQASKGLFISEWHNSLEDLLRTLVEQEKII